MVQHFRWLFSSLLVSPKVVNIRGDHLASGCQLLIAMKWLMLRLRVNTLVDSGLCLVRTQLGKKRILGLISWHTGVSCSSEALTLGLIEIVFIFADHFILVAWQLVKCVKFAVDRGLISLCRIVEVLFRGASNYIFICEKLLLHLLAHVNFSSQSFLHCFIVPCTIKLRVCWVL